MDFLPPAHSNFPEHNSSTEFSPQLFMADFADATHELLVAVSPAIRAQAAHRLASLGIPLASAYLVAALGDSAWEVRQAAVESLAELGGPESITKRFTGEPLARPARARRRNRSWRMSLSLLASLRRPNRR